MSTQNIAKSFINERPAFNKAYLAKEIGWAVQNMHAWLLGKRPIPAQKLQKLEEILNKYGYRQYLRANFQQAA